MRPNLLYAAGETENDTAGEERTPQSLDEQMMRRCLALAAQSSKEREYPFGAVVARKGDIVAEATNRVARDCDVTRHAEIAAITEAQRLRGNTDLSDCTLYSNVEPCALCSYAIREARLGRVVFALRSPVMGGFSRWSILNDRGLSATMPQVFDPPPEVVAGVLAEEADSVLRQVAPVVWAFIRANGLLLVEPQHTVPQVNSRFHRSGALVRWLTRALRMTLSDRFGRGRAVKHSHRRGKITKK
ncbi:MAG TPA: nucleoside deaminase [Pseudolabrys sp.]|nr:nucleoside deaminase [Pseudolabrys sp.]